MTKKCNACHLEILPNCDWNQGRCPHALPLINLKKLKMEIQPRDTSKGHFYVSLAKSGIRMVAGVMLITGNILLAGVFLIVAEVLGIAEELV
jgi:hypothetical protein